MSIRTERVIINIIKDQVLESHLICKSITNLVKKISKSIELKLEKKARCH